jgi:hypothetical protein
MLFSNLSDINGYQELISNSTHNSSNLKDFKDNTLHYSNFDIGIKLSYFSNWNITYESPNELQFSLIDKEDKKNNQQINKFFFYIYF